MPVMSSAQAPQGGRPLACGEPKSAAAAPTRAPDVSWGRRAPPAGAAGHEAKNSGMGRDGCAITVMTMLVLVTIMMLPMMVIIIIRIVIIITIMMMPISSSSS